MMDHDADNDGDVADKSVATATTISIRAGGPESSITLSLSTTTLIVSSPYRTLLQEPYSTL